VSTLTVKQCEEIVRGPGKFEGEARYVPYLYNASLEFGDVPGARGVISVEVTQEDKALFPELRRRKRVRLYERDDGLVEEVR